MSGTPSFTLAPGEWICKTAAMPEAATTRGLGDPLALWERGRPVSIGFLQGSPGLQRRVLDTAKRWTLEGEGRANLSFVPAADVDVDAAHADIRIGFDPADGSWSMIGTQARQIAAGKPTMNLGWATEDAPDDEFASVVLHEFGHAIGLLHEHNHPRLKLNWKKHVVYADLGAPPNSWSRETIDFNVFEQYPEDRVLMSSEPDQVSIMIYTIPARWLDGQPGIMPSNHLSSGDIIFVQSLYP